MRLSIIHETDNQLIKKFLFFSFLFPQKAVLRKTIHLLYVPCLPARLKVQEKERHQNIYIKANQSPSPATHCPFRIGRSSCPCSRESRALAGWPHTAPALTLYHCFFLFFLFLYCRLYFPPFLDLFFLWI